MVSEYDVAKNIVQVWLDDCFNFEDRSVGIEAIGKFNKCIEEELSESGIKTLRYEDEKATLIVFEQQVDIAIVQYEVGPKEYEGQWEVVENEN